MTTFRVGVTLSQSGAYALQGRQALQGLRLWIEDTNRRGGLFVPDLQRAVPLELLAYDDQSRRADTESLIERLITRDRVDFLIGPYSSGLARAAARVAETHRKLLWNHGGSSDAIMQQGFRWTVTLPTPASRYFEGLFRCLQPNLPDGGRVAIVRGARGSFAGEVAGGIVQRAQTRGFDVLPSFVYPETADRFPRLVEHLAAGQPDLIVGIGSYREDVWLVRALAATRPEITALALVATPMHLFWEELGEAAEGCIGPSQWEPHAQGQPVVGPTSAEFIARFQRRFGAPPDYPSAQAYAAGLVLEHCVAQAGTWTDAALRDQACELDCQTFYGRFRLASETGAQTGHETVLVQWQRGAKRLIWPRAMADAAPVCPKPWVTPLEPGPGAS